MGFPTERPFIVTRRNSSGATISRKRFVKNNGEQCHAIGQKALGVSWDGADDGKDYPVAVMGTVLVTSGEGLQLDVEVTTNAVGKAIKASRGQYVNGRTMSSCSAAGEDVEVFLCHGVATYTTTTTSTSSSTSTSTSTSTSSTTTTTD